MFDFKLILVVTLLQVQGYLASCQDFNLYSQSGYYDTYGQASYPYPYTNGQSGLYCQGPASYDINQQAYSAYLQYLQSTYTQPTHTVVVVKEHDNDIHDVGLSDFLSVIFDLEDDKEVEVVPYPYPVPVPYCDCSRKSECKCDSCCDCSSSCCCNSSCGCKSSCNKCNCNACRENSRCNCEKCSARRESCQCGKSKSNSGCSKCSCGKSSHHASDTGCNCSRPKLDTNCHCTKCKENVIYHRSHSY